MKLRQLILFPKRMLPRRRNIKRMHVIDGGEPGGWANMWCFRCQHQEDGFYDNTLTELRRGLPCPNCNAKTVDVLTQSAIMKEPKEVKW